MDIKYQLEEFLSGTYLEKAVKIVKSFSEKNITGEEADKIAIKVGVDLKDLQTIFRYGYQSSKELFKRPKITLDDITSNEATYLEKTVLLAFELNKNNIPSKRIREYADKAKISPIDVKNIYLKIEKELKKSQTKEQTISKINQGISEDDLNYTYNTLHKYILYLFLYTSPAYTLVLLYQQGGEIFNNNENFLEYMNTLSNGNIIEEKISKSENAFIDLFLQTTTSTRIELTNIVQSEIGNIFAPTTEVVNSIKKHLYECRNIINKDMKEFIAASNQLRQYIEKPDADLGSIGIKFY